MSVVDHAYLLSQPLHIVDQHLKSYDPFRIVYQDVCTDDFLRQLFRQIILETKSQLRDNGNLIRVLDKHYKHALHNVMGQNELAWMLQYAPDDIILWFIDNIQFASWPSKKEIMHYNRHTIYNDPRWIRASQKHVQ